MSKNLSHKNGRYHKSDGFSFVELLIVFILIGLGLTAVVVNINSGIAMMSPEQALAKTASLVLEAKANSLLGQSDIIKRTFNIESVLQQTNGVTISTLPDKLGKPCQGITFDQNIKTFCVSGVPFLFNSDPSFIFSRFDGKTAQPHAIFFTSSKRALALLISQTGDVGVAEYNFVSQEWRSRTDLQQLYLSQNDK